MTEVNIETNLNGKMSLSKKLFIGILIFSVWIWGVIVFSFQIKVAVVLTENLFFPIYPTIGYLATYVIFFTSLIVLLFLKESGEQKMVFILSFLIVSLFYIPSITLFRNAHINSMLNLKQTIENISLQNVGFTYIPVDINNDSIFDKINYTVTFRLPPNTPSGKYTASFNGMYNFGAGFKFHVPQDGPNYIGKTEAILNSDYNPNLSSANTKTKLSLSIEKTDFINIGTESQYDNAYNVGLFYNGIWVGVSSPLKFGIAHLQNTELGSVDILYKQLPGSIDPDKFRLCEDKKREEIRIQRSVKCRELGIPITLGQCDLPQNFEEYYNNIWTGTPKVCISESQK
jgi:hypothetical protein